MSAFILIKDPKTQKIGCIIQSKNQSVLEFPSIDDAQSNWQLTQFGNFNSAKKELYEKVFLCVFEPKVIESDFSFIALNFEDVVKNKGPIYTIRSFTLLDTTGQTLWNQGVPLVGTW